MIWDNEAVGIIKGEENEVGRGSKGALKDIYFKSEFFLFNDRR